MLIDVMRLLENEEDCYCCWRSARIVESEQKKTVVADPDSSLPPCCVFGFVDGGLFCVWIFIEIGIGFFFSVVVLVFGGFNLLNNWFLVVFIMGKVEQLAMVAVCGDFRGNQTQGNQTGKRERERELNLN